MNARVSAETKSRADSQLVTSYALFIIVAALLVGFFAAPAFRVSRVTVTGAVQARSEIEAATGVVGADIYTMNAAAIWDAVWRVPNVLPCGVTLSFPNSVTVCARMRQPVLGWDTGDALYLVDKYGRIISTARTTSLPILRDTTHIPRAVGKNVNPWIVTSTKWVLRQMPHAAIDGFTLRIKHGVVVRSAHHWRAILGMPADGVTLRDRVAKLKALIGHGFKIGHPLAFADLTGGQAVVVRFRGTTSLNGGTY